MNWIEGNKLKSIAIAVAMAYLLILVTGTKVLISETKIEPGQEFYVEEWGDVGDADQASLVCKYFTGRKILDRVFWYSPNNIMGRDTCPFLLQD